MNKLTTTTILSLTLIAATHVHSESLFKNPGRWVNDTVRHVARDVQNTGRALTEDNCVREERRHGPEAGLACRISNQSHSAPFQPSRSSQQFIAGITFDCVDPASGRVISWIDSYASSPLSLQHAVDSIDVEGARQQCWAGSKGHLGNANWKQI